MNTSITPNNYDVKPQLEAILTKLDRGDSPDGKYPDSKEEYWTLCPFHGDVHADDFSVSERGYNCFACGESGGLYDLAKRLGLVDSSDLFRVTPEMKIELEKQRQDRKRTEHENHLAAIETLQKKRPDILYHKTFIDGHLHELVKTVWGVKPENSDHFNLGYCNICPTYHRSDSITLPYYWSDEEGNRKLINLRHRLLEPNGSGKYRPEMAGLPSAIFNADRLQQSLDYLILVEGEFKAIVLEQQGLPTVAIPGANIFKEKWARLFHKANIVYVTLDPGVNGAATKIGIELSKKGVDARIVTMPVKPDDFFTVYHGTAADFEHYLRLGKRL